MSQDDNIEAIKRAYAAIGRGDLAAVLEMCDPGIEFDNSNAAFDARVYKGREGLREFFTQSGEMWESQRFEPEEFIPIGEDQVLVPQRIISRGRGGIETTARNATLYTLRGAVAVHIKSYQTKALALQALGLSE